jgi:hypothetical protein
MVLTTGNRKETALLLQEWKRQRRAVRSWVAAIGISALCASACVPLFSRSTSPQHKERQSIHSYNLAAYDALDALALAAEATPANPDAVLAYAAGLIAISPSLRANLEREALLSRIRKSNAQLAGIAAQLDPDRAVRALSYQSVFFVIEQNPAAALDAARRAFSIQPSFSTGRALVGLFWNQQIASAEAVAACGQTHDFAVVENVSDEDYQWVLEACLNVLPEGQQPKTAYPAIAEATWENYDANVTMLQDIARELQTMKDAERQAQGETAPPSSVPGPPAAAAPAAPPSSAPIHVTLYNPCPQTVLLFIGKKPKYGSGTSDRIGSNQSFGKSLRQGDMIWIVDSSGNGISAWTASQGVRRLIVTKSCTGFMTE